MVIENKDFESLIKVYDKPGALFYLDPPYHGTEKYYDNQFSEEDHMRLKAALDDLYKGYHIEEISRNLGITNKEEAKSFDELIIRNY